ncbi:hypothetical protein BURMUCF1_A0826 [Burkholderia multivorans ATCC BAA-247]|nr:hypothetical protein BURMUCF1_A0826 [Burkholderia multivorans ATCC BAA-247]
MCTHAIESGKDERTTRDPRCAAIAPLPLRARMLRGQKRGRNRDRHE